MLVSFQGKSHGVFGVAIMVSSENVLYSFLVRKGVNRKKTREEPFRGPNSHLVRKYDWRMLEVGIEAIFGIPNI